MRILPDVLALTPYTDFSLSPLPPSCVPPCISVAWKSRVISRGGDNAQSHYRVVARYEI